MRGSPSEAETETGETSSFTARPVSASAGAQGRDGRGGEGGADQGPPHEQACKALHPKLPRVHQALPDLDRWLDAAGVPGIALLRAAARGDACSPDECAEALVAAVTALQSATPRVGWPAVARLQMAVLAAYLKLGLPPGSLCKLAGLKTRLLGCQVASADSAGDAAARRGRALLPLKLLVVNLPRTPAQRQLAVERLLDAQRWPDRLPVGAT